MPRQNPTEHGDLQGSHGLILSGAVAALLAALIFRRNFGVEISMFSSYAIPVAAADWFDLLAVSRWVGIFYLGLFDLTNAFLLAWVFAALYTLLRTPARTLALAGLGLGVAGALIYMVSSPLLSILHLSRDYLAATSADQQGVLLAAAEAVLAPNNPGATYQGTAGSLHFLFMAGATLCFALGMRKSPRFQNWLGVVGIVTASLDLVYCLALLLVPGELIGVLGIILVPLAGLGLMVWHLLTGLRLLKLSPRQ
jgi:hypothetical protein